jgi:HNH endonuclease
VPVADRTFEETQERFWAYVTRTTTCWIWQGVRRRGYGRFKIRGHYYSAHRLAYEWLVGPIPGDLTIDHVVCSNRACVNPSHMELVTLGENTARSNRKRRGRPLRPRDSRDSRGWRCSHPRVPENIYTRPGGYVECRTCRRNYMRQWKIARATAERGG